MRKGTPEQLMDELNKKIDELKGSPNSGSRVIVDDEEDVIVAAESIGEDDIFEVVKDYYYDHVSSLEDDEVEMFKTLGYLDDGSEYVVIPEGTKLKYLDTQGNWIEFKIEDTPYTVVFNNLDGIFEKDIDDGYFKKVETDEITSSEEVEDIQEEVESEEIPVEVVEDDKADYLTGMYASVEKELRDLTESVAWDSDEDSIYLDVNFADGHVFTFTIPKADLAYDLEDPDKDIEYICNAVRGAGGAEASEDEYYDDYSDEEYEDYSDEEYEEDERDLYL